MVKVGDLVYLYRRKNPGLGLVVKHLEDAIEELGIREDLDEILTDWHKAGTWKEREGLRTLFTKKTKNRAIAEAFMHYNSFYSPSIREHNRLKREFVWVSWIKLPSDYEMNEMKQKSGWFPLDWFKKYQGNS